MQKRRQVLQQLLTRNPTVAQVDAEMGNTLYRIASSADAKDLAKIWTNPLNDPVEVQAKVGKWPQTRVYLKSPMVYLIYFNADGVMRDFTCLSN